MPLEFDWDKSKDLSNRSKHGVSFSEAASAFEDGNALIIEDPEHSESETRSILLGRSANKRLIVVVYTFVDPVVRVISARIATPTERRQYKN